MRHAPYARLRYQRLTLCGRRRRMQLAGGANDRLFLVLRKCDQRRADPACSPSTRRCWRRRSRQCLIKPSQAALSDVVGFVFCLVTAMKWLAERLARQASKISGRIRSGNRPPPFYLHPQLKLPRSRAPAKRGPLEKNCVGDRAARSRQRRDLVLPRKLSPNGQKQTLSTNCRIGRFRSNCRRSPPRLRTTASENSGHSNQAAQFEFRS